MRVREPLVGRRGCELFVISIVAAGAIGACVPLGESPDVTDPPGVWNLEVTASTDTP